MAGGRQGARAAVPVQGRGGQAGGQMQQSLCSGQGARAARPAAGRQEASGGRRRRTLAVRIMSRTSSAEALDTWAVPTRKTSAPLRRLRSSVAVSPSRATDALLLLPLLPLLLAAPALKRRRRGCCGAAAAAGAAGQSAAAAAAADPVGQSCRLGGPCVMAGWHSGVAAGGRRQWSGGAAPGKAPRSSRHNRPATRCPASPGGPAGALPRRTGPGRRPSRASASRRPGKSCGGS